MGRKWVKRNESTCQAEGMGQGQVMTQQDRVRNCLGTSVTPEGWRRRRGEWRRMTIGRNKIKRSCEVKMEKFGFYSESNEKLLEGF